MRSVVEAITTAWSSSRPTRRVARPGLPGRPDLRRQHESLHTSTSRAPSTQRMTMCWSPSASRFSYRRRRSGRSRRSHSSCSVWPTRSGIRTRSKHPGTSTPPQPVRVPERRRHHAQVGASGRHQTLGDIQQRDLPAPAHTSTPPTASSQPDAPTRLRETRRTPGQLDDRQLLHTPDYRQSAIFRHVAGNRCAPAS